MYECDHDLEALDYVTSIPFFSAHLIAIGGAAYYLYVGTVMSIWLLLGLAVLAYYGRMWAITAGFHRYFSHRTFKTSRVFQFIMAFIGTTANQKGVLWWAAHHRDHHKHSDQEEDIHSPTLKGFFWSHVGWILCRKHNETKYDRIPDFAKYPELVWLNKYHMAPPLFALGVLVAVGYALGVGMELFIWMGMVSTIALYHGTFCINSFCHIIGSQRFKTTDTSKNSLILALICMGEGWHNNHHHYPGATRNGFYWYEIDLTYYSLVVLSWFGIVWNLRPVPERVLELGRQPIVEEPEPVATS